MKPVFAHIKSSESYFNLGDIASCPQQYFPDYADCDVVDLDDISKLPDHQPVILGGGGLFGVASIPWLRGTLKQRPVIVWGAGLNYPGGDFSTVGLASTLFDCSLTGIRDPRFAARSSVSWVPCASCMHPAFQLLASAPIDEQVVVYRHAWGDNTFLSRYPSMNNMDRSKSVTDILEFLSRGRTVITNSYHGAYWSMLLNKRVFLWRPEGLRFYSGLPYLPPIIHSEEEWDTIRDFSPEPPDSRGWVLQRCQQANIIFKYRIDNYLTTLNS